MGVPNEKSKYVIQKSIEASFELSWENFEERHRTAEFRSRLEYEIYSRSLEHYYDDFGDDMPFHKLLQDFHMIWDNIDKEKLCPLAPPKTNPNHS